MLTATNLKRMTLSAFLGGAIFFAWSSLSWMVLPWHKTTINTFKNEATISKTIKANTDKSGMYYLSSLDKEGKPIAARKDYPFVFAAVHRTTTSSMDIALFQYLLLSVIGAFFISWLLVKSNIERYGKRVCFVSLFAIAAGIVCYAPDFIWWHFDWHFLAINFADLFIGWFLASLLMAKIVK